MLFFNLFFSLLLILIEAKPFLFPLSLLFRLIRFLRSSLPLFLLSTFRQARTVHHQRWQALLTLDHFATFQVTQLAAPEIRRRHLERRSGVHIIVYVIVTAFLPRFFYLAHPVFLGEHDLVVEGRGKPLVILHVIEVDVWTFVYVHLRDLHLTLSLRPAVGATYRRLSTTVFLRHSSL